MMKGLLVKSAFLGLALAAAQTGDANGAEKSSASGSVSIDVTKTGEPISQYVYGQFIEHLGRCIYGGIWAEMLEDRKFYFPVDGKQSGWSMHSGKKVSWEGEGAPYEIIVASPWQILGPATAVAMNTVEPFAGSHDPVITLDGSEAPRGIYQPRLGLQLGRQYTGYVILKASSGVRRVEVALQWGEGGKDEQAAKIESPADAFAKHAFSFTSGGNTNDGRLAIRCYGEGKVRIGSVSLMPADNVEGFRKDTLALLRELDSPIYRWPGGNFVSGYDWRDGVGDRDRRPPRKNPAWTGLEHNDVGIHEYMRFCELVEAEPFIALNTGLGDAASAAAEVEYITGPADSAEGARRAANGRKEPWRAIWWAVGNEMYGNWQLGHMPLEQYVQKHNEVVEKIRAASPQAKCIAVGNAGPWSKAMLENCSGHMELISEHLYWQRKENVREHVQVAVDQIQRLADTHRGYRQTLSALNGKDIRISLDEWNYWYGPNLYGEIGVRYFMRDALGIAAGFHAMFRNSDLYFMANYAQTVNVIGAIKTTKTGAFLETTGHVLKLYRHNFGTIPVAVGENVKGLDVAAAWTQDRKILTLSAVNTTREKIELDLNVTGLALPEKADGWTIQHDDPDAFNDENNPDTVTAKETTASLEGGRLTLKPYSVTLLRIPVGADTQTQGR
ncbi:MAG TPA: alpha-L-arabinofuranosidase C-terminal domain-containing protein [Candidatus Brocadiia bacterium]|nr:alpha-L-arabinofuranosidase C-terminal domain-containing protein [Candidatus Brocadiia bacterium]